MAQAKALLQIGIKFMMPLVIRSYQSVNFCLMQKQLQRWYHHQSLWNPCHKAERIRGIMLNLFCKVKTRSIDKRRKLMYLWHLMWVIRARHRLLCQTWEEGVFLARVTRMLRMWLQASIRKAYRTNRQWEYHMQSMVQEHSMKRL